MKNYLFILLVIICSLLIGCSNTVIFEKKPPNVYVQVDGNKYDTTLGSYCWGTVCADAAGPVELVQDKEPIKVKPGETISIIMDYNQKPSEIHLSQINNGKDIEIDLKNNSFTAPLEKGIYYYSYGAWWMDDQEENIANGDAFYAFHVEIIE